MNENAGAARTGDERAVVLGGDALEDARSRGADGKDAAAVGARAGDELGGGGREVVAFFVHDVLAERGGFHGREGAEADVQRDEAEVRAGVAQLGEECGREVQSGGGRGDGAGGLGKDGLVALAVAGGRLVRGAFDVGRERGFPRSSSASKMFFGPENWRRQ